MGNTYCTGCGHPRELGATACERCGQPFPAAAIAGTPVMPDPAHLAPAPIERAAAVVAPEPVQSTPAEPTCANHPAVPAVTRCASCGLNICGTCDFIIPAPPPIEGSVLNIGQDTHLCPNCIATRRGVQARPGIAARQDLPLPGGVMCSAHPEVNAVRRCGLCKATMCATCDFEFPGHFHLCPTCATNPQKGLSPRRKKSVLGAYALAVWSTVFIAVLVSGALAGLGTSKGEAEALYTLIGLLILVPTVGGVALSLSALDKKLGNPPILWGAAIWNSLLLLIYVLLTIIGSLS